MKDAGTPVGTQPSINFIEGSNITLTITNDAGNNEVDVEIAASGGSGSPAGSDTEIQFNNAGAFGASAQLRWDAANGAIRFGENTFPDGKIFGFAGTASQPNGGNLVIASGEPYNDGMGTPQSGGSFTLSGNDGINGGSGGGCTISGGFVNNGAPGDITITAGGVFNEGNGGSVAISATNGSIDVDAGHNGGSITLTIGLESVVIRNLQF